MTFFPVNAVLGHAPVLVVMKLVLVASVGIGVSGTILAWRERSEPGSIPLVFLLAGQCWWSAALLFRITGADIGEKIFWVDVSWLGTVVIPVAWLFFSLEYTGYHRYVRPRYIALASLIPAITAFISLTNDYHHLLYVDSTLIEQNGATVLTRSPGGWHWVIAGYTYLLGVLGAIPLLQFIRSDVATFRGQSVALLVALVVPWATNILYLGGFLPTAGIDPTPVAFTVSGVVYLGAITRFQLFGKNPTPIRQARLTVFDQMDDGAVVIDSHGYVVDMNEQATEILEMDPQRAFGSRVETVIPNITRVLEDETGSSQAILRGESDKHAYDISINQLTDTRGRQTGRIVTLHDITEYVRQQQRLEVLNRVFRHNVRTSTQVIVGKADYLATHNSESEAEKVQQNALEIEAISEKVRTVLDVFEQGRENPQPVRFEPLLRESISRVENEHPDVTVTADLGSGQVYVSRILDDVFSNALENAAKHNTNPDPHVWVEVERKREEVEVVVADDGPGIAREELALLDEGTETPLKHGSGFGLAIIVWGTEIAGGEVRFEENEPTGLVVTIDVPVYSRNETGPEDTRAVSGP